MFKNWDWDDRFLLLLWTVLITAIVGSVIFICSPKNATGYYLGQKDGEPVIVTMVNNSPDENIEVDRNIPLDSIVNIVSKLNNNLKHK